MCVAWPFRTKSRYPCLFRSKRRLGHPPSFCAHPKTQTPVSGSRFANRITMHVGTSDVPATAMADDALAVAHAGSSAVLTSDVLIKGMIARMGLLPFCVLFCCFSLSVCTAANPTCFLRGLLRHMIRPLWPAAPKVHERETE